MVNIPLKVLTIASVLSNKTLIDDTNNNVYSDLPIASAPRSDNKLQS